MHNIPINTIMHTNCIEGMKELPDNSIPLVVTSPPYGKMRNNIIPYRWEDFVQIAQQLSRITMVGGVICWVLRNQIVNERENCQAEREKLYFVDELGLWSSHTIIGAPMRRTSISYTCSANVALNTST
jgi:site-specific DNA-methyltransferase (adenine-specific)